MSRKQDQRTSAQAAGGRTGELTGAAQVRAKGERSEPQGRPVTLPAPDGADKNVNTEGDFVLLWNFTKMESGRIY